MGKPTIQQLQTIVDNQRNQIKVLKDHSKKQNVFLKVAQCAITELTAKENARLKSIDHCLPHTKREILISNDLDKVKKCRDLLKGTLASMNKLIEKAKII